MAEHEHEHEHGHEGHEHGPECEHDHDHDHDHEPGHEHDEREGGGGEEKAPIAKIDVEDIGPCKKRLKIAIARDRYKDALEKNYRELVTTIQLPGFRKGRVPRALLEKRFGKQVEEELRKNLIAEAVQGGMEEHKLEPLREPEVENVEFDAAKDPALSFQATLSTKPSFEVPALDDVRVERDEPHVGDDEVKVAMEQARRSRGELRAKPEDAPVEDDDYLVADIEWKDAGSGATLRKAEGVHFYVRNNRLEHVGVEDLAARLRGKKRGETVQVLVDALPDRFPVAEARGQKALADVAIREVKAIVSPELDDEFAKESGFDSLAEMREEVRSRLLRQKDEEADRRVEEKIIDTLLSRVEFGLPEDMVTQEIDELVKRVELRHLYAGATPEDAKEKAGELRTASRKDVERSLKAIFLLDRIAKAEKLYVTEDEVDQAVAGLAAKYGKSPENLRKELDESGMIGRLRSDLRTDKTRKLLRERAQVAQAAAQ